VSDPRLLLRPAATDAEGRRNLIAQAVHRDLRRFVVDTPSDIEGLDGIEEAWQRRADGGQTVLVRLVPRVESGMVGPLLPVVEVGDPSSLARAIATLRPGGELAIRWTSDRMIPLENAIAEKPEATRLWVFTEATSHATGSLGALEHGADRAVVPFEDGEDLALLERALDRPSTGPLAWNVARLTRVEPAGLGDRVIVDTTSLLAAEEGLLVGSAAAFLFLVTSEAVGSNFSRPRPFRVNAGAAHSYVLRPDGSTRYLSELEPGDGLLVARPHGAVRAVRVGRLKIERRPLVLVEAETGGRRRTVFLQEAETVRLATSDGTRVPTTDLRPGLDVEGVDLPPGRHMGAAIEESIEER
jgi:3-dehydroquinate synthase II